MSEQEPKRRYDFHPWEEYWKMGTFTLVRGIDYRNMTHGMVQCIRNASRRPKYRRKFLRNCKVTIQARDNPERIVVTVTKLPKEPK